MRLPPSFSFLPTIRRNDSQALQVILVKHVAAGIKNTHSIPIRALNLLRNVRSTVIIEQRVRVSECIYYSIITTKGFRITMVALRICDYVVRAPLLHIML